MIDRRTFLGASAGLLLWPSLSYARKLPESLTRALEESGFVYVSPLRSDGSESTCHGEVWYAWLDGAVVLNTRPETWKGRALARGLDRARIWVGDHGRWKNALGMTNEAFRKGQHFDARAELSRDAGLMDRLLAVYDKKYPEEIASWRDKMRQGFRDGSRLLIRYLPEEPALT